ncbi:MAG: TraM recognition domain-containing protein, partial [Burkholderiales bacterium]|nr:TraM recognition domain-containing protein [Burkholderiales bacterium]
LDTERVAKMVISDINATFAEFGKEKNPIKTFCCFDEFKSYETDAISKTISLHRSNGMHAIIGTQSLSLINRDIGNGILSNCQTHLVMSSADADAERFAEEFGKTDKIETTTRIRADIQEVSDLSTKMVRDYRIDKQDIKDIRVHTGQGYLHRKAVGAKPVKIQVQQKI